MSDYFRGWKRKAGLVTLLLACVLMVASFRSVTIADIVTYIFAGFGSTFAFNSHRGAIECRLFFGNPPNSLDWWFTCPIINYPNLVADQQIHLLAHGAGTLAYRFDVPHWGLALPLALLSSWLLLSKGRSTPQPPSP